MTHDTCNCREAMACEAQDNNWYACPNCGFEYSLRLLVSKSLLGDKGESDV